MTDINVSQLIINKLTKAQYDALSSKSETELYLVPDEIDDTPTSDSSNPVTSDGIKKALDTKQDTLVSGTNIKTINNQSVLGSGNLDVKDVFWVEYYTTPFADILAAYNAGKVLFANYAGMKFVNTVVAMENDSIDVFVFSMSCVDENDVIVIYSFIVTLNNGSTDYSNIYSKMLQEELISGTNIKTINGNSILGSGDLEIHDVFIAEYGVTTYQQVLDAYNAGKIIVVSKNDGEYWYKLDNYVSTVFRFSRHSFASTSIAFCALTQSNGWAESSKTAEDVGNKATDFTTLNNTKYPTTKAVADYAQPIIDSSNKLSADLVDDSSTTHKFVTSDQTETWNTVTEKAPLPFVVTVSISPEGVVTDISHTISEINAAYSANKQLRLKCTNVQQSVWFEEDLTRINQSGSYFYVSHTVTDEGTHYIITIYDDGGTTKAKFEKVDDKAYAKYNDVLINSITPTIASSTVTIDGYTLYPSEETFVVKPYQKIAFSDTKGDCQLYIIDATNPNTKTVISYKSQLITWDNQSDTDINIQVGINNEIPGTLNISTYWRGIDNVFIAEYNVTSVSEIQSAVDSGRVVMCRAIESSNIVYYQLSQSSSTSFTFFRFVGARYYRITLNKSTGVWSTSDDYLQSTSNRDSSIDSSASTTHYPSTKAVADYVDSKTFIVIADIDSENNISVNKSIAEMNAAWNSGKNVRLHFTHDNEGISFTQDLVQFNPIQNVIKYVAHSYINETYYTVTIYDDNGVTTLSYEKNLYSDKQDAPSVAGTSGQVLSLNSQGNPVWATISASSSVIPDEEDLTTANIDGTNVIRFKDKSYNTNIYSGLGKVYLRKNMTNDVNILTQSMINQANTIYVIRYNYVLGENITIPTNCVLEFDGGSVSNGNSTTLTGQNTTIIAGVTQIIDPNIKILGTWQAGWAFPEWFGAKGDGSSDDSLSFRKTFENFSSVMLQQKTYCMHMVPVKDLNLIGNGATLKYNGPILGQGGTNFNHELNILVSRAGVPNITSGTSQARTEPQFDTFYVSDVNFFYDGQNKRIYPFPDYQTQLSRGVFLYGFRNVTVENCTFNDSVGCALQAQALRIEIRNCSFTNIGPREDERLEGGYNAINIGRSGGYYNWDDESSSQIADWFEYTCEDCIIENCRFEKVCDVGITFLAANFIVRNCYFNKVQLPFEPVDTNGGTTELYMSQNKLIENCQFYYCGTIYIPSPSQKVQSDATQNNSSIAIIRNNLIEHANEWTEDGHTAYPSFNAIQIFTAFTNGRIVDSTVIIENNIIKNSPNISGNIFNIREGGSCIIKGNAIEATQCLHGIYAEGCKKIYIRDNYLDLSAGTSYATSVKNSEMYVNENNIYISKDSIFVDRGLNKTIRIKNNTFKTEHAYANLKFNGCDWVDVINNEFINTGSNIGLQRAIIFETTTFKTVNVIGNKCERLFNFDSQPTSIDNFVVKDNICIDYKNIGTTTERRNLRLERSAYNTLFTNFKYYDTTLHKQLTWDGTDFIDENGFTAALNRGTSSQRPVAMQNSGTTNVTGELKSTRDVGFMYFDTDLGKPIYAKVIDNSTGAITWIDPTENVINNINSILETI